jgi:type I restriction enzyme S subunit
MANDTVRLSELCDFVGAQVDPADHGDGTYIGLEHLASGRFEPIGVGKASDVQSSKYAFRAGDVLYGKLRPYLDKAALVTDAGICTTELLVLRPKLGVDPRFLVAIVHAARFVEHAVAGTTGVQHPRTSWNHIATFELPAFTPVEQNSIANVLWQLHDAIKANASVIDSGESVKRAAMQTLFTRGLRDEPQKATEIGSIPEDWELSTLGAVSSIERGRFLHRPRNEPRFFGGETPFVQTGDVVRSAGRIREFSQSLNADGVAISRVFPAGTILITIAANIGYTGILQFDSACPDSLVAITPRATMDTEFLEYWLQTQQGAMDRAAPKGTQKNINIQFLLPWPVVIPSLDEQHKIVAILDIIDRKIDLHRRKRVVLSDLFQALLHKLMTGEIRVDQLDLAAISSATPKEAAV